MGGENRASARFSVSLIAIEEAPDVRDEDKQQACPYGRQHSPGQAKNFIK
jgi:hypothetical protein